ncbi:MAG TPA: hypothetical protein PLU37_08330 [Chitinophagaceae bacterium]|nr:hypothetical protein [Chitinophagales bacterium]HPG11521.1 hypothetical protein [Chitinophagaceae bacterium]
MMLLNILKQLNEYWQQSAIAYNNYLHNGKTFYYATELRECNGKVMDLLIENRHHFPSEINEDVNALIHHYAAWTAKWEELQQELSPAPDDEFVFENPHRFPKATAAKIEALYNKVVENK